MKSFGSLMKRATEAVQGKKEDESKVAETKSVGSDPDLPRSASKDDFLAIAQDKETGPHLPESVPAGTVLEEMSWKQERGSKWGKSFTVQPGAGSRFIFELPKHHPSCKLEMKFTNTMRSSSVFKDVVDQVTAHKTDYYVMVFVTDRLLRVIADEDKNAPMIFTQQKVRREEHFNVSFELPASGELNLGSPYYVHVYLASLEIRNGYEVTGSLQVSTNADLFVKLYGRLPPTLLPDCPSKQSIRMLSLDGGGTRGLVEVEMLCQIEEVLRTHDPMFVLRNQFNVFTGTSTGAILAAALALVGIPLKVLRAMYLDLASIVFEHRSATTRSTRLRALIHAFLGTQRLDACVDANHADSGTPMLMILASDASSMNFEPFLFRNYVPRGEWSLIHYNSCKARAVDAVLASAAAPWYLKAVQVQVGEHKSMFVDGGLIANNPAQHALLELAELQLDQRIDLLLSLGTGVPSNTAFSGSLFQTGPAIFNLLGGSANVHFFLSRQCKGGYYFRLNPPDGAGDALLDERDPKKLGELQAHAYKYVMAMMQQDTSGWPLLKRKLLSPAFQADTQYESSLERAQTHRGQRPGRQHQYYY